jgi:MFS family permease
VLVSRLRTPEVVKDVIRDPRQRGILVAGCLSLFAVGLVPRVLAPGLPDAQEALKAQSEVENLYLLLSFVSAATIVLGGLVSDIFRRRSLLIASLSVMLGAAVIMTFISEGVVWVIASFGAVSASGIVLAYGIGSVAVAYEGVPRATALGFVYAAYGAATAIATPLLTLFGPFGPRWQAYLVGAIAAAVALWAAHRWMPTLPGKLPVPRPLIVGVAVWSISILAIVSGALGLPGAGPKLIPIILIVAGAIGLSTLTLRARRTSELITGLHLDKRALGAALAVGVAMGFAQAVPLMLLPVVFQYPLQYGPLFATLAIAPFVVALLLAGPASGLLLQRLGPRAMMMFGTLFLAVGNLVLAAIVVRLGTASNYLLFIAPLVFIGAGFVISTTVRTAIVFASTPRGLSASAAAINEASVSLGSRIGIIAGTTAVTAVALDAVRRLTEGRPDSEELVDRFHDSLIALGTPAFGQMVGGTSIAERTGFTIAYLDGVQVALVLGGLVGIGGAVMAWILIGRRDPLRNTFDMQDER